MNFLTPEEFKQLPAKEKNFAYKTLYESWVKKGGVIKRFKNEDLTRLQDRIRGAIEANLNKGVTQVNTYIIKTWWENMHQGNYLPSSKLDTLQKAKFEGGSSQALSDGTVTNWLTSMLYVWELQDWHHDELQDFDSKVRLHRNHRTRHLITALAQ